MLFHTSSHTNTSTRVTARVNSIKRSPPTLLQALLPCSKPSCSAPSPTTLLQALPPCSKPAYCVPSPPTLLQALLPCSKPSYAAPSPAALLQALLLCSKPYYPAPSHHALLQALLLCFKPYYSAPSPPNLLQALLLCSKPAYCLPSRCPIPARQNRSCTHAAVTPHGHPHSGRNTLCVKQASGSAAYCTNPEAWTLSLMPASRTSKRWDIFRRCSPGNQYNLIIIIFHLPVAAMR